MDAAPTTSSILDPSVENHMEAKLIVIVIKFITG